MSSEPKQTLPEDDFDIEQFSIRMYKFIQKVLHKLLFPFRVLLYKPLLLLLVLLLSVALSWTLKKVLPPVYSASFILKPANPADLTCLGLLNDVSMLVKDQDEAVLADVLHMDASSLKNWTRMTCDVQWNRGIPDTLKSIIVHMRATDTSIFRPIQQGLLSYLEKNEHYSKIRGLREQEIASLKQKLHSDILEIDSLKNKLALSLNPRGAGGFVYGEPLDPVRVYDAALNLYRQQLALNWQEQYLNSFELIKSCTVSSVPSWPRTKHMLVVCLPFLLLVLGVVNYRSMQR